MNVQNKVRCLLPLAEAMALVEQQDARELQAWEVILQDTLAESGCPVAITADQLMRLEAWGMYFDFATGQVDLGLFEPNTLPVATMAAAEWVQP